VRPAGEDEGRWRALSTVGAPVARTGHSALWTGSEMLVWGGSGISGAGRTSGPLFDGGRYDPHLDRWTPMSSEEAPAVERYVAVWTGTEMIVWGAALADGERRPEGGRYDPRADVWSAISLDGAPGVLEPEGAAWTGSEMLVWGGIGQSGLLLAGGGRYSPETDSWRAMSTVGAPPPCRQQVALWTDRKLVVWGGVPTSPSAGVDGARNGEPVDATACGGGRYDASLDRWAAMAEVCAPAVRSAKAAVWTGAELVIWAGGSFGQQTYPDGGRYDPEQDIWHLIAGPRQGRLAHTAVWTGSELVAWGGLVEEPAGAGALVCASTGWRYHDSSGTWTALTATEAPDARTGHTAVWTGSEMIVWGGLACEGGFLADGGRYLPQ